MALVVMKFGGTSVANVERIRNVGRHVKREIDAGNKVAVVVSAMAGATNQLVAWVREASLLHDAREYDAVVASGEQVTAGLLAIVLQSIIPARSWQGWLVPILTSNAHGAARILDIKGEEIAKRVAAGEVAVVTGFQGLEPSKNRVATLGRGGSDERRCPRRGALRRRMRHLHRRRRRLYDRPPHRAEGSPPAARLLRGDARNGVTRLKSLADALRRARHGLWRARARPVQLRGARGHAPVRMDRLDGVGTIVCDEDEIVEQQVVSIAYAKDEAKVTILKVEDKPGIAARIFGPLAEASINVDMIVQNITPDGKHTDMTFTVQAVELPRTLEVLEAARQDIGYFDIRSSADVVKVSVIGIGMRSHAGVAAQMFQALADKRINILAISTSEIKISVLIDAAYAELAVRTLHAAYGLDAD